MIPTSWIYNLKKEELVKYLEEFEVESTGTVEELRKRFTQFVGERGSKHEARLRTLAEKHTRSTSPRPAAPDSKIPKPTMGCTELTASSELTTSAYTPTGTSPIVSSNIPNVEPTRLPVNTTTMPTPTYTAMTQPLVPITHQVPPSAMTISTIPSFTQYTTVPTYSNYGMTTTNYTPMQTAGLNTGQLYPHYSQLMPLMTTMNQQHATADPDSASLMDKVRKWSIRYAGDKSPLTFIERIEELAAAYGVDYNKIPPLMSELLLDKALAWYRYSRKPWPSWVEFKHEFLNFFLPPRYLEQLDDTIRARQQQPKESFKDYVVAMMALMRYSTYSEPMKLERIFRNCRQAYQLHIKRREFQSLNELIELAGDFEIIESMGQGSKVSEKPPVSRNSTERSRQLTATATPKVTTDPRQACRRCGQHGHFARRCKNPQVIFCWECGKQGTRTIECCRKPSENISGTPPQGQ